MKAAKVPQTISAYATLLLDRGVSVSAQFGARRRCHANALGAFPP